MLKLSPEGCVPGQGQASSHRVRSNRDAECPTIVGDQAEPVAGLDLDEEARPQEILRTPTGWTRPAGLRRTSPRFLQWTPK
jgi:hypothetical protein